MSIRKMLAAALALAMIVTAPALASSISVVTNQPAQVYTAPAETAHEFDVPEGLGMQLTAYADGWGRVTSKGVTGYIPLRYLNLKSPIQAKLAKDATIYSDTGMTSLGVAPMGTVVYFLGMDGEYAHIADSSRTLEGYVALSDVTTAKSLSLLSTTTSPSESRIEYTIYVAQNLMGRPYALYDDPPNSFNCASFVRYCYDSAQADSVSPTLYDQVHDETHEKIASVSDLRRGDLVCFNFADDTDPFGHVGIYLGGGAFIHASSSGMMVTVSRLSSGYYRNRFSWGLRIFDS